MLKLNRRTALLPPAGHVVEQIVQRTHEIEMHAVVNQTFPLLRRRFWETRQSSFLLLDERIAAGDAGTDLSFHQVGLDFAEPLHVREENQAIKKVYICLFTCMVTHVVQLELVTAMTTTCFLTFKQADSFVPALLVRESSGKLREELAKRCIEWKYSMERAPWNGSSWERLVCSSKNALRKVLGTSLLRSDELQTILCKLEVRINDRLLALELSLLPQGSTSSDMSQAPEKTLATPLVVDAPALETVN
ncbi:hypothetical protein T01_6433 [Trichinella spiralis]|uniref:Uncharacterized protein n=1 Tax=Trichinella spiralis TaxID=6334 RepID=A0A0V1AW74_TRISP|nr:hypothetical protein T01_6433 [Trichinella spiralis]